METSNCVIYLNVKFQFNFLLLNTVRKEIIYHLMGKNTWSYMGTRRISICNTVLWCTWEMQRRKESNHCLLSLGSTFRWTLKYIYVYESALSTESKSSTYTYKETWRISVEKTGLEIEDEEWGKRKGKK